MKLKYQQGGTFVPPFAVYQPFMIPTADEDSGRGNKKSSSDGDGLDMKDIYSLIKDLDGLPGDMSHVSNQMNQLLSNIEYKLNNSAMFGGTSSIAAEYMQLLNLASNLKFQRDKYNKAYDTAVSNGSIHEAAINARGQIMVLTNDGPSWITPEEYAENSDQYHVVTNQELLNFRAQGQGGLAFNTEAITTVSNGMGISTITDIIGKAMQNLGKTTESAEGAELMRNLNRYVKASDSIGSLKVEDIKDSRLLTEDQLEQAQLALNYIRRALPPTALSLLKMKTDGTVEGANAMLLSLVHSKLSSNTKLEMLDKSKKSSSVDSLDEIEIDPVMAFLTGKGNVREININTGNSVFNKVIARESVITKGKEKLAQNDTLADVTSSDFAGILDFDNTTFGGVKVAENSGKLFLLENAIITGMDLPIDQKAQAQGLIRPDFDLYQRIENAEEAIRMSGATTNQQKNEIYEKNEIPENFKDASGNYDINLVPMQRFARITGVIDADALVDREALNSTVVKVDNNTTKEVIKSIFTQKDKNYEFDSAFLGFGHSTEYYKGAIYMPVVESLTMGTVSSGNYVTAKEAYNISEAQKKAEKLNSFNKAQSLSGVQ